VPLNENYQSKVSDAAKPAETRQDETLQKASNSSPYEEHKKILWKKLETYRDKLLRLEQSNRSILLRRIYAKWSFDLSKLSIRGSPAEQLLIERAFKKKNSLCLIPDSDDSELADKDRTKLRSLSRNTSQLELETGLQEAYLGFPFLVGHVGVDTYVRGPLVLFPISLEYRKLGKPSGWYLNFTIFLRCSRGYFIYQLSSVFSQFSQLFFYYFFSLSNNVNCQIFTHCRNYQNNERKIVKNQTGH
jgi:hypothetical protein